MSLISISVATTAVAVDQQAPQPVATSQSAFQVDNAFVQKQFGANCSLLNLKPVMGDLDGDGVEDIVIPARCTKPMLDEAEFRYTVIDPFFAFYGYGNPAITTQYSTEDPQRKGYCLLIIHGAGADAWHADQPKAKFLVVNLEYDQLMIRKLAKKKKTTMALYVEEAGSAGLVSAIYWDGKKYKYEPMGSSLE
ncbi:MAG TPA: hypothetical protein VF753_03525 [Terriglobales bacterium]